MVTSIQENGLIEWLLCLVGKLIVSVVPQKANQEKRKAEGIEGKFIPKQLPGLNGEATCISLKLNCMLCVRGTVSWLGAASVRSSRACPCWAQPALDAWRGRSATLLLSLGKRVPKGQKAAHAARTGGQKCQNQPCKLQGQRRTRGGEAATEIPLQPVEATRAAGIEQVLPCSLGEDHAGAVILQPLGNATVGIPRRSCGIWKAQAEARHRCVKEGAAERNWY